MLDVKNLERRWFKYKIKRIFPYILIVVLLLAFTAGLLIWRSNHATPSASVKIPASVTQSASPSAIKPASSDQQAMILEPSMNFIQSMDIPTADPATAPTPPSKPIAESLPKPPSLSMPLPTNKILQVPGGEEISVQPANPSLKTAHDSKPTIININRNESKIDIIELQKRFKETSNPNLGLFIARDAYNRGDYAEAYNYALKTNAINSHLDESWLIFAKSLVKIGKTDQAKKTLQLYIANSNSDAARALLTSIERGDFK